MSDGKWPEENLLSAEFYLSRVLSGPTDFYLDQYEFRTSFILTGGVPSRPSVISTEFYLNRVLSGPTEFY